MIPWTAIIEPSAHSKSATALLTIRVAFFGSSIMPTGTLAGVSTSSSSFELHAATSAATATIVTNASDSPAAPVRAGAGHAPACSVWKSSVDIRPLLGSDRVRSVAQADRENERRQLGQVRLIEVHGAAGHELALRIEPGIRRPRCAGSGRTA